MHKLAVFYQVFAVNLRQCTLYKSLKWVGFWGSAPYHAGGAYSALLNPLAQNQLNLNLR